MTINIETLCQFLQLPSPERSLSMTFLLVPVERTQGCHKFQLMSAYEERKMRKINIPNVVPFALKAKCFLWFYCRASEKRRKKHFRVCYYERGLPRPSGAWNLAETWQLRSRKKNSTSKYSFPAQWFRQEFPIYRKKLSALRFCRLGTSQSMERDLIDGSGQDVNFRSFLVREGKTEKFPFGAMTKKQRAIPSSHFAMGDGRNVCQ